MSLTVNVRTDTITAKIGSIRVKADYAMLFGHKEVEDICPLISKLVDEILDRVKKGQDLKTAIYATDTSYGSTAEKLQRYVAPDDGAGWCLPDSWNEISPEEYDVMVRDHDVETKIYLRGEKDDIIDGFSIRYLVRYGDDHGRNQKTFYHGSCWIDVPRFRRISRRENRKHRKSKIA